MVDGGVPKGSARLGFAQMILQATYAYAIPSPETLRWIVAACEGRTLVEIGAGRGYWAHQIALSRCRCHGIRLRASRRRGERVVSRGGGSVPCGTTSGARPMSAPVGLASVKCCSSVGLRAGAIRCRRRPYSTSSARWPWLIYIGEDRGGKTGDDAYFDALADRWELTGHDDAFVSWWNLADVAQCWDFKG